MSSANAPGPQLSARPSSRVWWRRILLLPFVFAASVGLGYGIVGLGLWSCQSCVSSFIFEPNQTLYAGPADFSFKVVDVKIPISSGDAAQSLHGWWIASTRRDARAVLYLHGNDGNVSTSIGEIGPLRELGYSVLMIDYRGYGRSEGSVPSEETVYQDAEAAWNYLIHHRGIRAARLHIYGHSLGGAIAIELALRHPEAAGLIVESSFTSIAEMAKLNGAYALLPMQLSSQRFDSINKVGGLRLPVLYIHGTADEIVPYAMGEQLYKASGGSKHFVPIGGGLHGNNAAVGGRAFRNAIRDFIEVPKRLPG
jgi:pimeloyl-ACP methyl ester carboxylesterase